MCKMSPRHSSPYEIAAEPYEIQCHMRSKYLGRIATMNNNLDLELSARGRAGWTDVGNVRNDNCRVGRKVKARVFIASVLQAKTYSSKT